MSDNIEPSNLDQATIQRCPHDGENPYAMISRDLIRDENISPECRWLIIYLLSNKDGWVIKISQVASHVKVHMSKNKVYDLFKEAIEVGYVKKDYQMKGNLTQQVTYFVSEKAKFKKSFRHPGFREIENRDLENRTLSNNINKNKHKKEDKSSPMASPISPFTRTKIKEEKKEVVPRVWMTPSQEDHLLKKLEGDLILMRKCLEKLSDWKIGKGMVGGKNDYQALVSWVIEAVKNEELKTGISKDKVKEDQKMAEKIWNKNKTRDDISFSAKYIEFYGGQSVPIVLEFGSKDFRNKCLEQLKKRKIPTEGL